ncbi:MAG TPA: ATP-binding protein [Pirellulales bacterium]|jgi:serine/threonine-protein kinase RsbW|nr:ATP-binding protein [Pirellulales bacterium]
MNNHSDWTWTRELKFPSLRGAGQPFLGELLHVLKQVQWSEHEIFGIHLAVEEALVNAIRHGNGSDSSKHVHVACKLSPHRLLLEITDEGAGFDPTLVPDCTQSENLQRPGGRGIMLMRNYMSRVEYIDGGHRVVMEKHRTIQG